ncbi:MAG: SelT/SelW/SelH family protein [Alcanivorax sediminis]|uniref:SelT/SelW/SelH family protein n=1 Tax=Alcanivorax sediminis TaxID=2663008 RepID=A0A6N7LWJ1_9GAMM|nr:SelT/SelW/SelH family protein [Alcanivorax sediminis]MQX54817.1 SelT/SelW/SelH family protein [Alcanivorax sediminis]
MKRVTILYCSQCNWLLRSGWYAQELLNTFSDELDEVALQPGTGGVFRISANDLCIWERKKEGGFPEITELKRRVRDALFPERDLGHIDRKK